MKSVVIYSGGADSYTLLNLVRHEHAGPNDSLRALSFNYGQRHAKELTYAEAVCKDLDIPHKVVNIKAINDLLQGSSLTTKDVKVPEGHYEDESMKSTYVPNRNMIMLSLAVGYAVSTGCDSVYYAAHAGDHAIYPDCRPQFVSKMNQVTEIANYQPVYIRAPFLEKSKTEIIRLGLSLGLDYSKAWSCYKGEDIACGVCGTCQERLEAFATLGKEDPIAYKQTQLVEKKKK